MTYPYFLLFLVGEVGDGLLFFIINADIGVPSGRAGAGLNGFPRVSTI